VKDNKLPLAEILLLVGGLAAIVALQTIFRRPAFFDEDDYLANVALLHHYGFGKQYLTSLAGSAGPLYSMVHFLFEPLTHLQALYIRWVNAGFLIGTTCNIYFTLRLLNPQNRFYTLYVMAIPMTYTVGGLALTEMPAMFFFSAAIYFLLSSTIRYSNSGRLLQLILAGCCMSLAIMGRQPYLLTLTTIPLLFTWKQSWRNNLLPLLLILACSLALPGYVFAAWEGLVPTIESHLYQDIADAGVFFRVDFFLLCVFYLAISILLIAPGFFRLTHDRRSLVKWAACAAVSLATNFIFKWIAILPVQTLMQKIFVSAEVRKAAGLVCGSAVIFSSLYFGACLYRQLQRFQYRKEMTFFAAACLVLAVSCGKITTGFSSMYAAQAIPPLVLLGSFFYRPSKYNPLGIALGMITGLLSLASYFTQP